MELVGLVIGSLMLVMCLGLRDDGNKIGSICCGIISVIFYGLMLYVLIFAPTTTEVISFKTNYVNDSVMSDLVEVFKVTTHTHIGSVGDGSKYYIKVNGASVEVKI